MYNNMTICGHTIINLMTFNQITIMTPEQDVQLQIYTRNYEHTNMNSMALNQITMMYYEQEVQSYIYTRNYKQTY